MIAGDEWKTEGKVCLSGAMAKRYAEAGTVFLFQVEGGPILEAQVKKVSANEQYVLLGPEKSEQGAWLPAKEIVILDVLVPMQEKQEQKPVNTNELLAALLGVDQALVGKQPKKGKDKQ